MKSFPPGQTAAIRPLASPLCTLASRRRTLTLPRHRNDTLLPPLAACTAPLPRAGTDLASPDVCCIIRAWPLRCPSLNGDSAPFVFADALVKADAPSLAPERRAAAADGCVGGGGEKEKEEGGDGLHDGLVGL
jgi:hypothetical protein